MTIATSANLVKDQQQSKVTCMDCPQRKLCMPGTMNIKDIDRFDAIVKRSKPLLAGEKLIKEIDLNTSLIVVRSGSIKTSIIDVNGIEQVTGFHLPGEITGLDGIGSRFSGKNTVAMEYTTVCKIPFKKLANLAQKVPGLQHHLFQLMSSRIVNDQKTLLNMSRRQALARVATFFIDLSMQFGNREYSSKFFRLPMSRIDIGNFLGLRIETVSRTVASLHRDEIIQINGRELRIRNYRRLEQLGHQGYPCLK